MIKKILSSLLSVSLIFGFSCSMAHAVDCFPNWNGTWTVEANCTWPGNYKVYGDIIVGDKIITVSANKIIGIDLNTNKITFTTGKLNVDSSSKINNSVTTRYYKAQTYSNKGVTGHSSSTSSNQTDCDHGACTSCPSGTKVMNTSASAILTSAVSVGTGGGNMYCAKE